MQNNKLKIGLIGYGKMGKTIERLAISKHHEILLRVSSSNLLERNTDHLDQLDVAIEFTAPEAALKNLSILAQHKVPTICGSTGWYDNYDKVCAQFTNNDTPFLAATNFSIGVNVFFAINKYLAKIMKGFPSYNVDMVEAHHIEKKDAPSGTAVTLAQQILSQISHKNGWVNQNTNELDKLGIESIREADVKGTHTINYKSTIDKISIEHEAFSRDGFALGAIHTAEWIVGRKGIFTMEDVFKFES